MSYTWIRFSVERTNFKVATIQSGNPAMHSASVSAYLVTDGKRIDVAKINRDYITLSEACELAPKTKGQLNIVIDEKKSTRMIVLNEGVSAGQREARHSILAPF